MYPRRGWASPTAVRSLLRMADADDSPIEPPGPAADPVEHLEFRKRLRDAALEAELQTGDREDTVAEARAHITIRLARMTSGTVLLLAGVAMLALPGPGWLVIALGLGVLAKDVAWADRTLDRVRKRLPADADGKISRPLLYGSIAVAVVVMGASLWWSFLR